MLNLFINIAHAQNFTLLTHRAGAVSGSQPSLIAILASLINFILGLLGVILLVYIMLAGFYWMTAGGNEDNVKKAKTMMMNATVGLIIVIASFAIATFVQSQLGFGTTGIDTTTGELTP